MTTTLAALLLSATVLLLYELRVQRDSWLQDLQAQADLVARASLPVQGAAQLRASRENLGLLSDKPHVDAVGLYDAAGRLVAGRMAPSQAPLPARLSASADHTRFDGRRVELLLPVREGGVLHGSLLLRAHYDALPRLLDYLAILGIVTLASLILAALVAQRLQRTITEPIVAIAGVAREVVQTRNYGLRAPRMTRDEVGALVEAFNDMLAELGGQAEALQKADRRKDEFLATLAHELRNPLAPIMTALAILARPDTDRATLLRMVDMMQRQMQHLVRLIDDLMEVSRITTGRLTLRIEKLDLVAVVRAAVEGTAPLLLARQHALQADWPAPIWLLGDRTRLVQVFANLLSNAAKYTEPGGRIAVDFITQPGSVAVQVSDNGIGIAPERQADMFEMFTRIDNAASGVHAGLGVGLAVARQLVAMHEGQLLLRSAGLGQGSVFTVLLPRPAGDHVEAPPAPVAAPAPLPSRRRERPERAGEPLSVLVADDNVDFADSLAAVLQGEGYRVRVAHDGQQALQLAREALPDVGLFDIGMPGLDGFQLARAVRAEPGGATCMLAAITGWGQQADRQRAREAGFDEHLVKPVDMQAVLGLLATA